MKLKQLEGLLGNLDQFSKPKIELEQYPTGPHIASRMLFTAENSFGDVRDKVVADFGCGCGTLGLAASLLGAQHVVGFDVDSDSIEIASVNAEDLELDVSFVQCDIQNLRLRGKTIDTVVMNPPFGTRKKGADMDFLSVALQVASGAVYSLHKTTTRDNIRVFTKSTALAKDIYTKAPLFRTSRGLHCEISMPSVQRYYVSSVMMFHNSTSFIRKRKLI